MTHAKTNKRLAATDGKKLARVLFYSPYEQTRGIQHGGILRHEQIKSIAAKAGYSISLVSDFCRPGLPPVSSKSLRGALYPLSWIHPKRIAEAMKVVAALHAAYDEGIRCLIHEHHFHAFPQAIGWARKIGFKVIVCPHNIESLIPRQYDRLTLSFGRRYINVEMKHLAAAHERFFIARNDAWLAANFGAPGHHLPYRPIISDTIRNQRTKTMQDRYVAIASATNSVSREGLLELIDYWQALPGNDALHIAGNGTESIRSPSEKIVVHGRVSEEALSQLYTQAKAIIAHQHRGTGALTRIPEAVSNGIPVLANAIAIRDYELLEGVYRYENPSDLQKLLQHPLPSPPAPSLSEEQRCTFVNALR